MLRGDGIGYLHPRPIYEWDTAAPAALALAAGMSISDVHGEPLRFGQAIPQGPGIVVSTEQHEAFLTIAQPCFASYSS